LRRLAVVDLDFLTSPFYPGETGTPASELYGTQVKVDLNTWKAYLIEVLKNSPSKERKFLRWKVGQNIHAVHRGYHVVLEEGELEVFSETSL